MPARGDDANSPGNDHATWSVSDCPPHPNLPTASEHAPALDRFKA
jgi:hypothetical protein